MPVAYNNCTMELLAPAGSPQILRVVIAAGADAVYLGGDRFGARAYAPNFTQEELLNALDYAHLRGVKVYLTVNTLFKNEELAELPAYIQPLYERGLDAVLVQDFGALTLLHRLFPDLSIHASTQMTVTGVDGVRFLQAQGVQRVVLSRELSMQEIADIHAQTGMELEVFVHGALCYCYSGQCLFSSMLGGRSGNRGRCAQPCRLSYTPLDDAGNPCDREQYLLSLKDLCGLEDLSALHGAGVYSLKIEGRMKQAEYAAGVVSVYRRHIDEILGEKEEFIHRSSEGNGLQQDIKRLAALGSRCGFTDGYYWKHNGPDMVTYEKPNYAVQPLEPEKDDVPYATMEAGVPSDDKIKILGWMSFHKGLPMELTLSVEHCGVDYTVTVTGQAPEQAQKAPITEQALRERLCRTGDSFFTFADLKVEADEDAFAPVGAINRLRREGLQRLQEAVLAPYCRKSYGEDIEDREVPIYRDSFVHSADNRADSSFDLCAYDRTAALREIRGNDLEQFAYDSSVRMVENTTGQVAQDKLFDLALEESDSVLVDLGRQLMDNGLYGNWIQNENNHRKERKVTQNDIRLIALVSTIEQLQAVLETGIVTDLYLETVTFSREQLLEKLRDAFQLIPHAENTYRLKQSETEQPDDSESLSHGRLHTDNNRTDVIDNDIIGNETIGNETIDHDRTDHGRNNADVESDGRKCYNVYLALPPIFREHTRAFYTSLVPELRQLPIRGFLIRNYEEFAWVGEQFPQAKRILDHRVYTYNDEAVAAFAEAGADGNTVPLELNRAEIMGRDNRDSEMVVYGYYPLMTSAQCVYRNMQRDQKAAVQENSPSSMDAYAEQKHANKNNAANCNREKQGQVLCGHSGITSLRDRRGVDFPVRHDCSECVNVIYNSVPTVLFARMPELMRSGIRAFRLDFSIEGAGRVREVLSILKEMLAREGEDAATVSSYDNKVPAAYAEHSGNQNCLSPAAHNAENPPVHPNKYNRITSEQTRERPAGGYMDFPHTNGHYTRGVE